MVSQFDICRLGDGVLVVVLQDDVLSHLTLRVVAPLLSMARAGPPTRGLNPVIAVGETPYVLKPEFLSSVPLRSLGPAIGTARTQRDEIVRALDLLFTGI